MKTIKITMSFTIRADEDDSDSIREAVKDKLAECIEHDEFKFKTKELEDEEYEEEDE